MAVTEWRSRRRRRTSTRSRNRRRARRGRSRRRPVPRGLPKRPAGVRVIIRRKMACLSRPPSFRSSIHPGDDRVDLDIVPRQLDRHRFGELHEPALGRRIGGDPPGEPKRAYSLAILIILPPALRATIDCAAICESKKHEFRLVSMTRSQASASSLSAPAQNRDAGVVHQDVDRAELALDLLERRGGAPHVSSRRVSEPSRELCAFRARPAPRDFSPRCGRGSRPPHPPRRAQVRSRGQFRRCRR